MDRGDDRAARRAIKRQYTGGWRPPKVDRAQTRTERLRRARNWTRHFIVPNLLRKGWSAVSLPVTALFLLSNPQFHPAYGMTLRRKAWLAWRMYRTTRVVFTGTSYKAHLAMAAKLLEIPPSVEGVVVECGCFQGGSTVNLSLLCKIVGRKLIVYDSFEGLPPPTPGDRAASPWGTGLYAGSLDVVRENVRRHGALEVCTFRKGWFADTMPAHVEPVVLAFLDVDYQASIHDCMLTLWPKLTPKGYMFIDEYVFNDYCALFWSERYWSTYFDTTPPGLIGSGTGVGVGHFYLGPFEDRPAIQDAASVAYTRKDLSGYWDFYPAVDEAPGEPTEPAIPHADG